MSQFDDQLSNEQQTTPTDSAGETAGEGGTTKKPFVEPAISVPVDVLETTKFFFQAVESGSL